MAYLTREARKMLDAAGWTECQISASNSLDEYIIQDLLLQGAKIDMFGVGERMITARSEPVFGGVYKLAAVEDDQGNIIPKIKVSENVNKITIPHFKKVYRLFDRATGKAEADYLTVWDEQVDDSQPLELFDPAATWKRKTLTGFEAARCRYPCSSTASWCTSSPLYSRSRPIAKNRWIPSGTRSSALKIPITTMWICPRNSGISSRSCCGKAAEQAVPPSGRDCFCLHNCGCGELFFWV